MALKISFLVTFMQALTHILSLSRRSVQSIYFTSITECCIHIAYNLLGADSVQVPSEPHCKEDQEAHHIRVPGEPHHVPNSLERRNNEVIKI